MIKCIYYLQVKRLLKAPSFDTPSYIPIWMTFLACFFANWWGYMEVASHYASR